MFLRYVTCNAKVSSRAVDTLCSEVPEYLHGRPHWFVRHCISHLRNAAEMDPGAVTQMTADAFQVTRRINYVNVQIIPRIWACIIVTCPQRLGVHEEMGSTLWN